jgi:hypothetical protein
VTGEAFKPLVDVVRDLGGKQLLRVLDQHAGHVQCHVAVADHGNFLRLQRPLPRHVRVPVVPGNKISAAEGALQVDARDRQVGVLDGAGGEDHSVVEGAEIVEGEVPAVGDVAQEPNVAAVQDLVERVDDAFDPRMVRGNAIPDQPVRRRVGLKRSMLTSKSPSFTPLDLVRISAA